jgi:hypothetical protein
VVLQEVCDRLQADGGFIPNAGDPFWAAGAPAAVDPGALARQLLVSLRIRAIDIGMVPQAGPDRMGVVGLPVWLWVDDPRPQTVGPLSASRTEGGVTVSLQARLASVDWDLGDGTVVRCAGDRARGTAYRTSYGRNESPTCGHVYRRPGAPYTITATAHWQVDWAGGGQSGTIPLELVSTTTRDIGEIQVLTQ